MTAANPQTPPAVLIGPSSFAERDPAPRRRIEEAGFRVVDNPFKRRLTREEIVGLLSPDVIGLVAGLEPLDAEVLQHSSLKVVSRVGSGMANVDLDAARELGIAVHSTPSGPTEAVAELTLAGLLAVARMVPDMDAELHAGRWSKRIGLQVGGKTVAIIGYGRIGRRVAELLRPFRVRTVVVDPFVAPEEAPGCEVMSLDEALPIADIVSLHSSGEQLLIGEEQLARMKRGAILLNAARGGLLDEAAVVQALNDGRLYGLWMDTFEKEPYSGPLASCRNAVLTPHVGSYTEECRSQMETEAVENLLGALAGARR